MKNKGKALIVSNDSELINSLIPSANYTKLIETCFYKSGAKVKKPMSDEDFLKFAEEEIKKYNLKEKVLNCFNIDENDGNTYIYQLKGFIFEGEDIKLTQSAKYSNKYQVSYIVFTAKVFFVYTFIIDLLFDYTLESSKEFAYKDVLSIAYNNKRVSYYEEDLSYVSKKKTKLIPITKNVCCLEILFNGHTENIPIFNGESTLTAVNEIRKLLRDNKAKY